MIRHVPLSRWQAAVIPMQPPLSDFENIAVLPLADTEMLLAAHYYPLVVRLDGPCPELGFLIQRSMLARALTAADGRWLGAYSPIALRCFPLRLMRPPSDDPIADLELATFKLSVAKPRLLRLKDESGAPSKDLVAIYDGLKSIWNSRRTLGPALDLLLVAGLLVPLPGAGGDHRPSSFHTIDRTRVLSLSAVALEAMTRSSFAAIEVMTALTVSQIHLHASIKPPVAPPPDTGAAAAHHAAGMNLDTITPWLDTSALFPGSWAADAALWTATGPAGVASQDVTAPATPPRAG